MKASFFRILNLLLIITLAGTIPLSLLAAFSQYNQYFELLCHFKSLYFILSIGFLTVMLVKRKPLWLSIAAVWFLYNAIPILPYYWPGYRGTANAKTHLKIMQLNLLLDNQAHEKVVQLIQKEKPDIIGFEEVRPHWVAGLKSIEKDYPYRVIEPDMFAFGIALYSRYPLTKIYTERFGFLYDTHPASMPSISAQIMLLPRCMN